MHQDALEPECSCPNCRRDIPLIRLLAASLACSCSYHFRMKARQRILMIADQGSFHELYTELQSENPLCFPAYKEKPETVCAAGEEEDTIVCGTARIGGQSCCLFVMEPQFIMGSMAEWWAKRSLCCLNMRWNTTCRWWRSPSPAARACRKACSL